MNVIVLGKLHDNRVCVVEREDSEGRYYPIKYGDWDGIGLVDWWYFDSIFHRHPYLGHDFSLTDWPLVPVEYEGQYALVCLMRDYELGEDERLVKVGPASPQLIKKTLQDMWG